MEDTEIVPENKKEGACGFRYRQVDLLPGADGFLKKDKPDEGEPAGEILQIVAVLGAFKRNYPVKPRLFQFRKEGTTRIPSAAIKEYSRNSGGGSVPVTAHCGIGG
jgi:hypothetical protein